METLLANFQTSLLCPTSWLWLLQVLLRLLITSLPTLLLKRARQLVRLGQLPVLFLPLPTLMSVAAWCPHSLA